MAIYATQKAQQLGAKVVTVSDSTGWVYDPAGIDVALLKQVKEVERGRLTEYAARREGVEYHEGRGVWVTPCDIALPCATQNEVHMEDVENLVKNGCKIRRRGRQHAHHPRGHRSTCRTHGIAVRPRARRPTPAAWPPPVWR